MCSSSSFGTKDSAEISNVKCCRLAGISEHQFVSFENKNFLFSPARNMQFAGISVDCASFSRRISGFSPESPSQARRPRPKSARFCKEILNSPLQLGSTLRFAGKLHFEAAPRTQRSPQAEARSQAKPQALSDPSRSPSPQEALSSPQRCARSLSSPRAAKPVSGLPTASQRDGSGQSHPGMEASD
jgi:hypothetical protein